MMEQKKGMFSINAGILLGILGGAASFLESCIVVTYSTGNYGLVGLGVAIFALSGAVIIYKGSRILGTIIMFFSSLIGELTGGIIGLVIAVINPSFLSIFNDTFVVSSWTILSLIGSILILFNLWKDRGKHK